MVRVHGARMTETRECCEDLRDVAKDLALNLYKERLKSNDFLYVMRRAEALCPHDDPQWNAARDMLSTIAAGYERRLRGER